jgi:hypothetical protein
MIKRGDEQALLLLRQLARGDVESEAFEAYKTPYGVELGLACSSGVGFFSAVSRNSTSLDFHGEEFD